MEIFGDIIRFPTRRRTENALDVVRVDEKTNNLFIVNLWATQDRQHCACS